MRNTPRALDFFASLHLTIFERPANFEFFNRQLADRFKTANCRVGEKSWTAHVCAMHCASRLFRFRDLTVFAGP